MIRKLSNIFHGGRDRRTRRADGYEGAKDSRGSCLNLFKGRRQRVTISHTGATGEEASSSSKEGAPGGGGNGGIDNQGRSSASSVDPVARDFPKIHHEHPVNCVAPVASHVCVSGGHDKKTIVFNYNTGTVIEQWKQHEKEVTKVLCATTLPAFLSASRDKTVLMFQHNHPHAVQCFAGHTLVVTGLTLSPDETTLCTGSRDNSMKLWSMETGQCVLSRTISRNLITHLTWAGAGAGNIIAQSGEDKEVRIFDSRSLEPVKVFQKKLYIQTWCDISPDGRYCLTSSNGFGGQGCEATLWDISMEKIVHEYKGHSETVGCARFLPTSPELNGGRPMLATSSHDCTVRLWDRDSRACLDLMQFPGSGPCTSISIQPEGNLIVSTYHQGLNGMQLFPDTEGVCMKATVHF